jgi:C4-dicarboxylate transporter DctQ subunit
MCFRFLQVMWGFVRTGEVPHHDHAHVDGLSDDDQTFDKPVLQGAAR